MNNFVFNQSINYSILRFKENSRSDKIKIGFTLIFLTGLSIFIGLSAIIAFYSNQIYYQAHPNLVNSLSMRSMFADSILTFYLTLLIYSIITSGMGVNSPFLQNRKDAQFQLLIPVNPFVSFLSIKLYTVLRDLFLTVLICILSFGPLMLLLNKNTASIRLFFVILGFFFGVEIISILGNVIYLVLERLRVGKNIGVRYIESLPFISLVVVATPLIFIYFLATRDIPSYDLLRNYSLIPILNIAVGNVGFFFRSGVPLFSYISIVYSFILLIILISLNFVLIKKFYSSADLGDILPVTDFLENQKQMAVSLINSFPAPSIDKVTENVDFFTKNDILSLIKKEWILIKRTKELKTNFILVWCLVIVSMLLIVTKYSLSIYVLSIVGNYFGIVIGLEIGCLVTIYQSIKFNSQIVPIEKRKNFEIKSLFSFLFLTPFILLVLIKLNPLSVIFILAIILVSEILNRININSFMINFFIGFILFPLFTGAFLY